MTDCIKFAFIVRLFPNLNTMIGALISMFFIGILFVSNLLAKTVQTGKMIWNKKQFSLFSKKISKFLKYGFGIEIPNFIGLFIQFALIISLEWSPIIFGITYGLVYRDFQLGFQAFISSGSFVTLMFIFIWFCASVIENYKRVILFFLFQKNIFESQAHKEYFKSTKESATDEEIDIKKEMNMWAIISWLCCIANLTPSKLKKKYNFQVKHLWIIIGGLIFFIALTALLGTFELWELFTLSFALAFCSLVEILLNLFIFMPKHDPSRRRLKAAWDVNIIQRTISIIEDGFYQSPNHIYNQCKNLSYAIAILITGCLTLGMTELGLLLLIPLILVVIITVLYILRFNVKNEEKKEEKEEIFPNETIYLFSDSPVPKPDETDDLIGSKTDSDAIDFPEHLHTEFEHPIFRILSVFFWVSLILIASVVAVIGSFVFLGNIPGVFILAITILSAFYIFKRDERDSDQSHFLFFWVFVFITCTIFFLGNYNQGEYPEESNWAKKGFYFNRTSNVYPICDKSWHGLKVADYGFLSILAYSSEPYFSQDMNIWFSHLKGAKVIHQTNQSVAFYDYYIPEKNLSIISVRGTHSLIDLIQDVDIWKEIGLLQILSVVGPFVSFWPEDLTARIVYLVSLLEELFIGNRSEMTFYYTVLDDYVRNNKHLRNIILTGHSLGGGIANIVGAKQKLKAITFSSPGVVFSRYKFGLTEKDINSVNINIIPRNDIVAKVDKQGGLMQYIDCPGDWLKCHSLFTTLRELIRTCGSDEYGRFL
eukprot:gene7553-11876_t